MVPPLISVVIPTYNHARYVLGTLDSVFAQTRSDYEVIVVNDGSPDDTSARLRPLVEGGRIRYFEQANAGQAAARNFGWSQARGEFVAFLDDDDLWPPDKLAWQVAALRAHPEWIMVSGLSGQAEEDGTCREAVGVDGEIVVQSTEEMFDTCGMDSPGQALIRRDALAAVGGFDPGLWGSDDLDLWIRLSAQGPVAQIRRTALYYRRHAGNASHAAGRMFWNSVRTVRKNLPLVAPRRRAAVWRNALSAIYVYSGKRVVRAARHGSWRARWAAFRVLAFVFPTLLRDLTLARLVYSDLVPSWLHALRQGSRRTVPE